MSKQRSSVETVMNFLVAETNPITQNSATSSSDFVEWRSEANRVSTVADDDSEKSSRGGQDQEEPPRRLADEWTCPKFD
jgi:hypothetical protein